MAKDGKLKNFLKKIGKPLGGVLDFAGEVTGIGFVEKAGELIRGSQELNQEEKEIALQLLAEDVEDRASAREMQTKIATSDNSSWLSKNFIYLLASFWSITSIVYFFMATFSEVTNDKFSDTILGFMLGTAVSAIINFFFGSSEGSKTKDKILGGK